MAWESLTNFESQIVPSPLGNSRINILLPYSFSSSRVILNPILTYPGVNLGFVKRSILIPSVGRVSFESKVFLKEKQVYEFSSIDGNYEIMLSFPRWMADNLILEIWREI